MIYMSNLSNNEDELETVDIDFTEEPIIPEVVKEARDRGVIISTFEGMTDEEYQQLSDLRNEQVSGLPSHCGLTWDENGDLLEFHTLDEDGNVLMVEYLQETSYGPEPFMSVMSDNLIIPSGLISRKLNSPIARAASGTDRAGNGNGGVQCYWTLNSQANNSSTIQVNEGAYAAYQHAWQCSNCQTHGWNNGAYGGWSAKATVSVSNSVPGYNWSESVVHVAPDSYTIRTIAHAADGSLRTALGAELYIASPTGWSPAQYTAVRYDFDINPISKPTKGTVTLTARTNSSLTFSWSGFNFGVGGTWGKYQQGFSEESWQDCGQSTSITRTGLAANTTKTMCIRLMDQRGYACDTVYCAATTLPNAPSVGTIKVTSATASSVTCSVSGFQFAAGSTWGFYAWKRTIDPAWTHTGQTASFTYSGLKPKTAYTFEALLQNNYGYNSAITSVSYTTPIPPAPSVANSNFRVTATTATTCTVAWNAATSGGHGATISKYYVGSNAFLTWKDVGIVYTYTFTGLTPNTVYDAASGKGPLLKCQDNYGTQSAYKAIACTTPKPTAPNKGTITLAFMDHKSAKITWTGFSVNAGAKVTKYQQCLSTETVWTDCGTGLTLTRTGLLPNTKYTLKVRLVDNYGTASAEATTTFTTFPALPTVTKPVITKIEYDRVTATFSGTVGAGAVLNGYVLNIYTAAGVYIKGSGFQSMPITITGLSPLTSYKIAAVIFDNMVNRPTGDGAAANTSGSYVVSAQVSFTTTEEQAKIKIKTTASAHQLGKLWFKDDKNVQRKVKYIYVKQADGTYRRNKTL